MRSRRWTHLGLVMLSLAVGGGSGGGCGKRTELVVGVATDLVIPTQLDSISLRAFDRSNTLTAAHTWPLGVTGGSYSLPGAFGLVPAADPGSPIVVFLDGSKDGKVFVSRHAAITFVEGRTLFLRLTLSSRCAGKLDGACGPTGAAGTLDRWCIDGACHLVTVDPTTLPDYSTGLEGKAQCGSSDDAARLHLMPPDSATCPPAQVCQEATCILPSSDTADLTPPASVLDLVSSFMDAAPFDAATMDSALPLDEAMPDRAEPDLAIAVDASAILPDSKGTDLTLATVDAVGGQGMSDLTNADHAMPDLTSADLTTPDLAMPDLALPDLSQPDLSQPDLTRPDLVAPPDLVPGLKWVKKTSGTSVGLAGVWGAGSSDVFAVGASSTLLHSTDKGGSWMSVDTGNPFNAYFWGVSGTGLNDVYVVGGYEYVYRSTDGGKSFGVVNPGNSGALLGAWAPGPAGELWAVGRNSRIFHTTDGGSSWSRQTIAGAAGNEINGVWGASGGSMVASVFDGSSQTSLFVLRSQDQGASWSPTTKSGSPRGYATGVWSSGKDVWLSFNYGVAWHSSDDGATWTTIDLSSYVTYGVWGSSPTDLYIVGAKFGTSSFAILHSSDGATFQEQPSIAASGAFNSVWGRGPGDVYAVGTGGMIAHLE